jgi:hypothetical protein
LKKLSCINKKKNENRFTPVVKIWEEEPLLNAQVKTQWERIDIRSLMIDY